MKVILVCVNYNSLSSLNTYLNSIDKAFCKLNDGSKLTILIGDNSEKESVLGKYNFNVKYYFTGKNLGYLGGIEYAIKKSEEKLSEYDYIIISNVDLIIDEEFFEELIKIKIEDNVGCIAPTIYSTTQEKNRNPKILERPNRKKLILQKLFYQYPILYTIYVQFFYSKRRKKIQNYPEGLIYAAHGSFMIFTKKFAGFLQEMDYPCFLFGEEIYLAENLKKNLLVTLYYPKLRINDFDHESTAKMKSKNYYHYNFQAIDMLLKRYFNE